MTSRTSLLSSIYLHEHLLNERIPLPPLQTQKAVADYLDRETGRVDALIAAKQRMVGLFEERRQAVIHDAVAGRLRNGGEERRETAIPWLEDLPLTGAMDSSSSLLILGQGTLRVARPPRVVAGPDNSVDYDR